MRRLRRTHLSDKALRRHRAIFRCLRNAHPAGVFNLVAGIEEAASLDVIVDRGEEGVHLHRGERARADRGGGRLRDFHRFRRLGPGISKR